MNWNKLETEEAIENIKQESQNSPVLIFKHSTRCPVSSMALDRVERSWKDGEMKDIKPYYLDLVAYRNVSSKTAETFQIQHESPQVLLIDKGKCIYDASHMAISYAAIKSAAGI